MPAPALITILDEDHVMGLVRMALAGPEAADADQVKAFFAPEPFNPADLFLLGEGLRPADGVHLAPPFPDVTDAARQSSILLFRRFVVDAALIRGCDRLRLIQRLGERSDMIDRQAAAAREIWVSCLPRLSIAHTAEHAILLALAWAKQLLPADAVLRAGRFDPERNRPVDATAYNWIGLSNVSGLQGRAFGIVGLGEVGVLVARLARAFGMRVLYTSPRPRTAAQDAALGVECRSFEALLAESDFVSLHASNLPANAGLMGEAAFRQMQRDGFFINTSRGRLVDEDALYAALSQGTIAGAGLDVHRTEPRAPGDRFCKLPNVILTPHLAGGSRRTVLAEVASMLENCRSVLAGQAPRHAVLTGGGSA